MDQESKDENSISEITSSTTSTPTLDSGYQSDNLRLQHITEDKINVDVGSKLLVDGGEAPVPPIHQQDENDTSRNIIGDGSSRVESNNPRGQQNTTAINNTNWLIWIASAVGLASIVLVLIVSFVGQNGLEAPQSPHMMTTDTITVTWTTPDGNYDRVRLSCLSMDGQHEVLSDVRRNARNKGVCSNLVPGTEYDVTLTTILDSGASKPATIRIGSTTTDLDLPQNPRVTQIQQNQITVSWSSPIGGYDVVRLICTSVDGKHQEIVDAPRRHRGSNERQCTCVCLNSGTEYAITLVSILNNGATESKLMILDHVFKTDRSVVDYIAENAFTIGGAVLGMAVAPYATPVLLGTLGFGAGGIAAGSIGASVMSMVATSKGGAIVAGSVVALLQSAGASGLGIISSAAISSITGALGASVGAGVGGGFHTTSFRRSTTCQDIGYCL